MEPNDLYRAKDSNKYVYRDDIYTANANLFIANNNNPFLVSPYIPPANLAKQAAVSNVSTIVSSIIGNLSSVINLTTYTLSISTIQQLPTGNALTLSTPTLEINATTNLNVVTPDVAISGGTLHVESLSYFNYISSGLMDVSVANVSSLNASSFTAKTGTFNTLTVNSTLTGSTINTTNFQFITATGSTFVTNSLTVNSTLNTSTINTINLQFVTATGSTLSTNSLTVNSTLTASTISTNNFQFVTATGSTLTTNSLTVNSTLNVSTIHTTSLQFELLYGSTISTNTAKINGLDVSTIDSAKRISTLDLVFSSFMMQPSTFSTATTYITDTSGVYSSILINMNGSWWKIPVELA